MSNEPSTLTIEHTDEQGTTIDGTSRGDGTAEVLKTAGWRWSRTLGAWYIQRSRNTPPKRHAIARTVEALEAAGFTVAVSIDATPTDRDAVEARREADAVTRAERLDDRAERAEQAAQTSREAARAISDRIPLGQPILVGHHSEGRARRDAARLTGHMDASLEHAETARRVREAARTAAAAPGARHNPVTVANRLERLAASVRGDEQTLAELERIAGVAGERHSGQEGIDGQEGPGQPDSFYERLRVDNAAALAVTVRERLEATRADLAYWQDVRAQQLADGTATNYGRHNVATGDQVQVRGRWYPVLRANAKTVSVRGEFGARTTPWHEVQAHATADGGARQG